MTLAEAIKEAVGIKDTFTRTERVREVVDFMRFRLGWTFNQTVAAVEQSGVGRDQWEEILRDADST